MKKTLIIFLLILTSLGLYLSFADKNSEYVAERDLWRINQKFQKVNGDPQSYPTSVFDDLISLYNHFIKVHDQSTLVPSAHLWIGKVYMIKKDYKKAREKFEWMAKQYEGVDNVSVSAVAEIGRTYGLENDLPNVMIIYDRIIKEYPYTDLGMNTPILKAQYLLKNRKVEESAQAFNNAIQYYKKIIDEYEESAVEFTAMRLLAACYVATEQWQRAVNQFGEVLNVYAKPDYLTIRRTDNILKSINSISVGQLGDISLPINIYQKFIEEHPQHPFNKILEQMIKGLEELKEKNIKVQKDS